MKNNEKILKKIKKIKKFWKKKFKISKKIKILEK